MTFVEAGVTRKGSLRRPAPQQPRPSSRHRRIQVAAAPLTQSGRVFATGLLAAAFFDSKSASCARLRFKASIRLMTLGGSAIARGVVASPFVFASTSSRGVLMGQLPAELGRADPDNLLTEKGVNG